MKIIKIKSSQGGLGKAVEACEKAMNGNGHKTTANQNVSPVKPDDSEKKEDKIQSESHEVISKEVETEVTKEPEIDEKETGTETQESKEESFPVSEPEVSADEVIKSISDILES